MPGPGLFYRLSNTIYLSPVGRKTLTHIRFLMLIERLHPFGWHAGSEGSDRTIQLAL